MRNTAYIRYTVALVALMMGFALSIRYSERGFLFETPGGDLLANPPATPDGYDLQALTILNRVLLQMGDNYVEPERIDAHRMLVYALDRVQNEVPEVVTLFSDNLEAYPTEVEIRVSSESRVFEIGEIGSLWEMSFKLREIFRFMQQHLNAVEVDLRDVEYMAINGLLGTLDPHSVLLTPEVYEEMQANNRGSFGGLGIVISIRDGQLTIISPIADTPASRAGFLAGDRIVKINDESTINMPLDEAVNRLRGPEGSDVTIEVMRQGWTEPHEFTLTREIINIESVSHQSLGDGIGYIEIRNFQGNTHDDLIEALELLDDELGGIEGLVLDLRNNPGGLLQQAIEVTDTFLEQGTIVTTVGIGDRLREENVANPGGTQPFYPIVVLVNPGSASASEIVAGALKNHNRAVIVGDTTFGKGTVQVLYEFEDGSALKLTIAQYLTPGDVSIQGVGIVPDIQIQPVTVTDDMIDLYASERVVREGDLESSLTSERIRDEGERPTALVNYYLEPPEDLDPDAIDDPDAFEVDFEIDFARQLLLAADETWERTAMLGAVAPTMEEVGRLEMLDVQERLRNLNVDWTPGENVIQPVGLEITTNHTGNRIEVGSEVELTVTATNEGSRALYQVRAVTESDYGIFDDREFVFGRLDPGGSASWTVMIDVPPEDWTRYERVGVSAYADVIDLGSEAEAFLEVVGQARPHFGFTYRIDDTEGGNGDGLLQVGEDVIFVMDVTNVGEGDASESVFYIRNESEAALFLRSGREEVDALESGASHQARFEFSIQEAPEEGEVQLTAEIFDTVYREFLSEDLTIPVHEGDGGTVSSADGLVRVTSDSVVHGGADDTTPVIRRAPAGTVFAAEGSLEGWTRVRWGSERGWIAGGLVEPTSEGEAADTLEPHVAFQAPVIELDTEVADTQEDMFTVTGQVRDDHEVRDYYVMVFNRVSEGRRQSTKRVYEFVGADSAAIEASVPLQMGMNRITLVARDNDDASSSEVLYIYRHE